MSELLSGNGFSEIMCNSLTPAAWYEKSGDFDTSVMVRLANPLSSDLNVMRLSLLPGMLNTIAWNINRQNSDLKLYELGYVYARKKGSRTTEITDNYSERQILSLAVTGDISIKRWNTAETPSGFFHIKGYTELVLSRFGITRHDIDAATENAGWYTEAMRYSTAGLEIASFGKITKKYLSMFDIRQEVWYAEIFWENLLKIIGSKNIRFSELPKYPWVRRDLALVIDKSVTFGQIQDLAFRTERNLLREVDLFDVYESEAIGRDKKSYAVSFILRDERQTLTDRNIEKVMNALVKAFEREFGATLR
jgi:phenylalanyl-tRNA synthetase beta chain